MDDSERSKEEIRESEKDVEEKVKQLADMVREAQHLVVYTGAGVSTSAKIPDFRGPKGVWTLKEKGLAPKMEITIEQAIPTPTHMALVELQNKGILKYLVSQNVDGLHRRSGINPQMCSELHGNVYLEICEECGTEYLREYSVTERAGKEIDVFPMSFSEVRHLTGRRCEDKKCKGILRDSIIDFGESLPTYAFKMAKKNSKMCDVAIVLGSSLTVSPACDLPKLANKLVIVNLQGTPLDSLCSLRIHSTCDFVMIKLIEQLGLKIPEFEDCRKTIIYQSEDPEARFLRKPVQKNKSLPNVTSSVSIEGLFENKEKSCSIL